MRLKSKNARHMGENTPRATAQNRHGNLSPIRPFALPAVFRSQILDPVLGLRRLTRSSGHEVIRQITPAVPVYFVAKPVQQRLVLALRQRVVQAGDDGAAAQVDAP